MKVRLVCYEDVNAWILGKFALKLQDNLIKLGITVDISDEANSNFDINHHIIFHKYNEKINSIDTLMITHVDSHEKLELLQRQLKVASLGICMSSETMNWLAQMGIDKNKLCYINPAHDSEIKIKKMVIGITCRVQDDGRKRESFIDKLANELDPKYFYFRIMGDSWDPQVKNLREKGFEVDYYNCFIKDEYYRLILSLDYYLYTGMDEGQMGFIDAVAAGIKTIVTSQGYHLDAENAITHPFKTYKELREIFLKLQWDRKKMVDSVSSWNWMDYTKKHVELWEYLLGKRNIISPYRDGINSLLANKLGTVESDLNFIKKKNRELRKSSLLIRLYGYKKSAINLKKGIDSNGLGWFISNLFKKLIRVGWHHNK